MLIIGHTDAIIDPLAMMVKFFATSVACSATLRVFMDPIIADMAYYCELLLEIVHLLMFFYGVKVSLGVDSIICGVSISRDSTVEQST